ncbi:MAG: flagellar hook-length control protein FliK [Lachnospiraceae bacterium]|nr:flagellar hook-length control protein FliK [Ruminococcus sp.]MCM1273837.1 flagellar hook-length control protein FliK [Lachnospiraceae bacterium]
MAVSMNAASMRADFMISDAAIPQRMAELAEEQAGAFAQLLSDIGDANVDLAAEAAVGVVKLEMSDGGEGAESFTAALPDDDRELAKLILSGKIDMRDVPAERITPQFMRLLMVMRKSAEFNKDDEDDDEERSFDPAQAAAVEQSYQQELSNSMLMELYQIIEKQNENKDKLAIIEGIFESNDAAQTLPSLLTTEEEPSIGESLFTELVDSLVETVAEGQEVVEETAEAVPNVDLFVPSGNAENEGVLQSFAVNSEQVSEMPDVNERTVTVQASVSQNEQVSESAAQQTVPVEEFTVRTVKTEKPETAENAVQQQEVEEPAAVKVVTRNENAQQLDKTASEAPKAADSRSERVKSATDELEMLKNAKARSARPAEEESEVKPEHTAQPLNADSPIVLRREDGSEIEVRPSEVVEQTAKLVEKAVTENEDKTEYSMVLNPEELGRITVKLTKAADGAISVTIAAENARTQRILEQNSDLMQSNLRSNGVNLESWQTVGERQQETLAQDYNGSSKNPYYREDNANAEEESDDKTSFAEIIAAM